MDHRRSRWVLRWALLGAMGLLAAGEGTKAAWAQTVAFCNVTRVETQLMSNAVRLTVHTDGALRASAEFRDFAQLTPRFGPKWTERIRLRLLNARSQVGSLVDVGVYPVSHILFTIPPEAKEGVGLNMEVVLYKPGRPRNLLLSDMELEFDEEGEGGVTFDVLIPPHQRGLILTIASDRQVHPPRDLQIEERLRRGPQALEVEYREGLLSVHAVNQELRRLMGAIAEAAKVPILVSDRVVRLASAHFEAKPVTEAILALANAYGLACRRGPQGEFLITEGTVRDAAAFGQSEGALIPLRYLPAQEALNLLPNFLLAYVRFDEERNALVAFGSEAMVEKLRRDVARLDQPTPQVEIQVLLVEMEQEEALHIQPRWEAKRLTTSYTFQPLPGEWTYTAVARLPRGFDARLVALEKQHQVKIEARAHLKTLNGQPALLFLGSRRYFQILRSTWRAQEVVLTSVDVGIRLHIVPITGGEEVMGLYFAPEMANVLEVEPGTNLPTLGIRRAEGVALLRRGETLLLGGSWMRMERRLQQRLPLLGDVPLLGELFRVYRLEPVASEFRILITPHWEMPKQEAM